MSAFEAITREEIEALRYLRDARKAALYLGIPQVQVEDVWAEMREPRWPSQYLQHGDDSSGLGAHTERRLKARLGSERLKALILQSMLRWADCNGTTLHDAGQFLLQGKRR